MASERTVTLQGNPLHLNGVEPRLGAPAPDFVCVDNDLGEKRLADYAGKVLLIASVPSLDTPVCDLETKRFNSEATSLSEDVQVLVMSMDLPFAQKRWCGAAGVDKLQTLSDHRDASFGENWGVLVRELRLLARGVFIVDREGVLRYAQVVSEVGEEPDYAAALEAVRKVVG